MQTGQAEGGAAVVWESARQNDVRNQPVDVIAVCGIDGSLHPLRFRYEDEAHVMHRVRIDEVLCCKEIEYVGIEAFVYTCRAYEETQAHMFELKFTVRSHCWTLFRVLY